MYFNQSKVQVVHLFSEIEKWPQLLALNQMIQNRLCHSLSKLNYWSCTTKALSVKRSTWVGL